VITELRSAQPFTDWSYLSKWSERSVRSISKSFLIPVCFDSIEDYFSEIIQYYSMLLINLFFKEQHYRQNYCLFHSLANLEILDYFASIICLLVDWWKDNIQNMVLSVHFIINNTLVFWYSEGIYRVNIHLIYITFYLYYLIYIYKKKKKQFWLLTVISDSWSV